MNLPSKIYFHICLCGNGHLIRECFFSEAGDMETLLSEIDDDTVAVILLEDGVESDASEDVAAVWFKQVRNEIDIEDGEAVVPDFIRNHASDLVADLEGEIATERMNNRHLPEHVYAS